MITWNAANLLRGQTKELSLLHLLSTNKVDIAIITEAEMPETFAASFAVDGYTSFPAKARNGKVRLIVLIKTSLAVESKAAVCKSFPNCTKDVSIWIEFTLQRQTLIVGGIYRPWVGLAHEKEHVEGLVKQLTSATSVCKKVLVCGDLNLDQNRTDDVSYTRRRLLQAFMDGVHEAGLEYHPTPATWRSHGRFAGGHIESCLDHVYSCGMPVFVSVLPDAITDHRPLLATVDMCPKASVMPAQMRRNFNKIERSALLNALEKWPWSQIYTIHDEEEVHDFIVKGITGALDEIAPLKTPKGLQRADLYLSKDTLAMMEKRDSAVSRSSYRSLRNKVNSMVRRDRLRTNLGKLNKAQGDPKVLWNLAKQALGSGGCTPLPASILVNGTLTSTKAEAADAMNRFYIDKIDNLRSKLPKNPPTPPYRPPSEASFGFSFANAAKISRIIRSLGNTTALGNDGIPTAVLKLGVDCLAGPVSHLVNRSLSNGRVPKGFKEGRIIPVHKGKGKAVTDPASYRPVSLLPAMSKVLELVVKEDLDSFLLKTGGLPNSQFGFRAKRSTTSAIATAHGCWLQAVQRGETVAILAFDFSAAFDTVDPSTLIEKLERLGVKGRREADWFRSYMTGGHQIVDWNGARSKRASVKYGVRQGSILGPLLFLAVMADLPTALGIEEDCIIGYADDVCLWATGKETQKIKNKLDRLAAAFVEFANFNALSLNPSKTQLLVAGGSARARKNIAVQVDDIAVEPCNTLDLLGVSFDSSLSSRPYGKSVEKATRQRAALVARLGAHLPRGPFLRQLACGIVSGKMGYASAAMAPIRLAHSDPEIDFTKSIQVAVNDAARTVTGSRRNDKMKITDLLQKARLPSYNQSAIRALALESWKAFHSRDGPGGERNPLGLLLFGSRREDSAIGRMTRGAANGKLRVPVYLDSMVANGVRIWNMSGKLREATTYRAAVTAARDIAAECPV